MTAMAKGGLRTFPISQSLPQTKHNWAQQEILDRSLANFNPGDCTMQRLTPIDNNNMQTSILVPAAIGLNLDWPARCTCLQQGHEQGHQTRDEENGPEAAREVRIADSTGRECIPGACWPWVKRRRVLYIEQPAARKLPLDIVLSARRAFGPPTLPQMRIPCTSLVWTYQVCQECTFYLQESAEMKSATTPYSASIRHNTF
jgi:hypothetical protein